MTQDLPTPLRVSPNIPIQEQTMAQLEEEYQYWQSKIAGARGWGSVRGSLRGV